MSDNKMYWAVLNRSFRAIDSPGDLLEGEDLHEGEPPVFPPDYVAEAEAQRAYLLAEAYKVIADWRTELALGMLEEEDEEKLKMWMLYIKELKALDLSSAPDIDWKEPPSL